MGRADDADDDDGRAARRSRRSAPKRIPLRDLQDGQRVKGAYAVRERELRRKRNGEPWLKLSSATPAARSRRSPGRTPRPSTRSPRRAPRCSSPALFEMSERWGRRSSSPPCARRARQYEAADLPAGLGGPARAARGRPPRADRDDPGPPAARAARALLRPGLGGLPPLPRRPRGEGLPPGLPARAARAHRSPSPRRSPPRPPSSPGSTATSPSPALFSRHRQDRGLQRRPAGDRPHRPRPPAGRDPARLLPGAPQIEDIPGFDPAWPRPSSTSSSATTARSSTARRSSPAPARPSSST